MNPAQREAYYRCRCGAARWESLSSVDTCGQCAQLAAPASEDVMHETVVAHYECCGRTWTRIFDMRRACTECSAVDMMPESRRAAPIGVAVGRCSACNQLAHEFNRGASADVFCRSCKHYVAATMLCSPQKFRQWSRRMTDPHVCAELCKALYLAPRRRVVRAAVQPAVRASANPFDALPGAV